MYNGSWFILKSWHKDSTVQLYVARKTSWLQKLAGILQSVKKLLFSSVAFAKKFFLPTVPSLILLLLQWEYSKIITSVLKWVTCRKKKPHAFEWISSFTRQRAYYTKYLQKILLCNSYWTMVTWHEKKLFFFLTGSFVSQKGPDGLFHRKLNAKEDFFLKNKI